MTTTRSRRDMLTTTSALLAASSVAGLAVTRAAAEETKPAQQRPTGGSSRMDIAFKTTDGTTLRGWHYLPDGSGKHPTIVLSHGFSAVKEMYLDKFAEAFARAGFASVVYDNRNFGASDGQPRQEIDPWLQIRDYSDAITFAQSLEQTDPDRIGIWGSSYSGGHVLVVAAIDRRVKCVVSQVPAISGSPGFRRFVRPDFLASLNAGLHADRANRAAGKPPATPPRRGGGPNRAVSLADGRFLQVVH
jgi:uncharacterized protein